MLGNREPKSCSEFLITYFFFSGHRNVFVGIHVPGEKPHGGSGSKGNHHHKSNRPHHRRRHHHLKSPSEAHRPGEFVYFLDKSV